MVYNWFSLMGLTICSVGLNLRSRFICAFLLSLQNCGGALVDSSPILVDLFCGTLSVVVTVISPLKSCIGGAGGETAVPQPLFHRIGTHEGAHGRWRTL